MLILITKICVLNTQKNFCNQMKLKKDLMRFSFFIMMILNGMRKQLKKLLEYFDMLGFNDPNVLEARKKLSSLMFK